jgi:PAS domain S-box-containing protein
MEVVVIGDAASEQWVRRHVEKLGSEGLLCHFLNWQCNPSGNFEPDLWLVDLDALDSSGMQTPEFFGRLQAEFAGKPLLVMAETFSLALAQAALTIGATRCLEKPVTPRILRETCLGIGVGEPHRGGRVVVLEDRASVYREVNQALADVGMCSDNLPDVQVSIVALRQSPPDAVVLSHYPESLSFRAVIELLRSFPKISAIPVFLLKGKVRQTDLLKALNGLVDVAWANNPEQLATAVYHRLAATPPASTTRHRLYEKFHDYEQERRAFHLHAIVSKTDRKGNILEVNERFCEISGYSMYELIGQNHRILKSGIHPPTFYGEIWATISQGQVWRGEICNRAKNGSHYWVSSTIVPCLDRSGSPYQYIAVRKDITHVKGAETLISQQSQLASRLGEAGAKLLDVGWQNGAPGLRAAFAPLCELLQAGSISLELRQTYPFVKHWPSSLPASNNMPALWIQMDEKSDLGSGMDTAALIEAPLLISDDRIGAVGLYGNVSAMAETFTQSGLMELLANILAGALTRWGREYEHDKGRERLRMAQKYSRIGTWEWDIATGELFWTEQIPVLFGYSEGELQTSYENFIGAVHPDDQEKVSTAIRQTIEDDLPYRIEHRVVWPDGCIRWLLETGDITRDESGRAVQMLGVVQDVTELREADLKLEGQASLLNMLHDSLTAFVLEGRFRSTLDTMLGNLLELTDSEFGYLAEVLYDDNAKAYLRIQAISDISWDAESSAIYSRVGKENFEFRDLDNLLGACIREGGPVIADQGAAASAFSSLPRGHPEIRSFMSIPIYIGPELVGTFALANRQDGYDENLIEFLRPFTATYGVIINSQRMLDMEEINRKNLVRAKRRADQANRAKSEFLASMSHELRTPLNAIQGFGQLLENDSGLDDEQQDNVLEILNASRHLLTLINEVLDLAKVESGKLELSLEVIPVHDLLEETLTLVRHSAHSRNIKLHIKDSAGAQVTADRTRLKQALLNLVSNAVKYNRVDGDVVISTRRHDDNWIDIRVSDTGQGIAPSRIKELFQPFNRLGAELSHIEGTGIGLALTHRLLDLMGGSVGVESQVDVGSTFWLRLPFGENGDTVITSASPVLQPDSLSVAGGEENTRTVLYIEDNPANLKLIARILQRYDGARLLTTSSGMEGVAMAKDQQPDIVLLDINLPDTDGYSVLRSLKASDDTADIPVIALTANAMHSQVCRGKHAGFDEYLTKPISVDELLTTLDKYLR